MLCPAVSDPFHGPFYRIFAICHQLFLILTLGKVFVIIARALNLLQYNNQLKASFCEPENSSPVTTCYRSGVDMKSCQPRSTGYCVVDRYDKHPGDSMLNSGHKNAKSCHCGGDYVSSHIDDLSHRNHNTGCQEASTGCCGTFNYSTQHIINGHLMRDTKTQDQCRKRVHDFSTSTQEHSETSMTTSWCCQHNNFLSSDLKVLSSNQESGLSKCVFSKEKSQNGHAKLTTDAASHH